MKKDRNVPMDDGVYYYEEDKRENIKRLMGFVADDMFGTN